MLIKVTDGENLSTVGFVKFPLNFLVLAELAFFANLQVLTQKQEDKN